MQSIRYPDNTDCLAIFLLFKLGVRIGELVALKWDDIDYESREIHINRMETKAPDEKGCIKPIVVEHTKKKSAYGDRFLPISDYEINLFNHIKQINELYHLNDDEYVFCDEKGRTKIRAIDNRIRKLCRKANIEVKSAHGIRRSVASELFNKGVPLEIIRDYLGHSDTKTTWGYIYDNNNKEKTARIIINSLSNMNGINLSQVSSM